MHINIKIENLHIHLNGGLESLGESLEGDLSISSEEVSNAINNLLSQPLPAPEIPDRDIRIEVNRKSQQTPSDNPSQSPEDTQNSTHGTARVCEDCSRGFLVRPDSKQRFCPLCLSERKRQAVKRGHQNRRNKKAGMMRGSY